MEKWPDTTAPGIDKQGEGFIEKPAHDQDRQRAANMMEAVEKDRKFYDSPENPGKDFNQNDQAYSQSSKKDFVHTKSKFHHKDDTVNDLNAEN